MTVTMNSNPDGKVQRKSLASQLDRLDSILDGLDEALAGAIADTLKEAVTMAATEAVRATLIGIVTNPDVITLMRSGLTPTATEPTPTAVRTIAAETPGIVGRLRQAITAAWQRALSKVKAVGTSVASRARQIGRGVVKTYCGINAIWRLKRPLLIALGIGSIAGIIAHASSPWFAGILSGIGALGATLGAQLAMWTRHMFAGLAVR
jgi:hypothetical protein